MNNFEKVDIFVVYLGTNALSIKMKVRFVISDPENPRKRFFRKSKIFGKKGGDVPDVTNGVPARQKRWRRILT